MKRIISFAIALLMGAAMAGTAQAVELQYKSPSPYDLGIATISVNGVPAKLPQDVQVGATVQVKFSSNLAQVYIQGLNGKSHIDRLTYTFTMPQTDLDAKTSDPTDYKPVIINAWFRSATDIRMPEELFCTGATVATLLDRLGVASASTGSCGGTALGTGAALVSGNTYYVPGPNQASACVSVPVKVNARPSVSVSPTDTTIYSGGTATLRASGNAASYAWSPSTGLSATSGAVVTASPTSTTEYTVTGTATNGCTASAKATVRQSGSRPGEPNDITASNESRCGGGSVPISATTLVGSPTFYLYSSSTGGTALASNTTGSFTRTVSSTTTFYLAVSGNGVTENASGNRKAVTVTVKPVPTVSITKSPNTTELTCTVTSITLTAVGDGAGSGATYSYAWSSPTSSSGATKTANAVGEYTVIATANGCPSNETSVTITKDAGVPSATITASAARLTCDTSEITLSAPMAAGNTYSWTTSDGSIPSGTNNNSSIKVTTAGTYKVTVTGSNSCEATSSKKIEGTTAAPTSGTPTADPTGAALSCAVTQVKLSAVPGGGAGTGSYTYQWLKGSAEIAGATGATYEATTSGSYKVKVTSNGCSATSSAKSVTGTVTTAPTPGTISADPTDANLKCNTTKVVLTANPSGGNSTYTYQWKKDGANIVTNGQGKTYDATETGSYTVTVASNGCSATSESKVVGRDASLPSATITASADELTCNVSELTLSVPSASSYAWTTTDGNITSSTTIREITIDKAGTYKVTVTGSNGCTASAEKVIGENKAAPNATISITEGAATLTCSAPKATLTVASGASKYEWSTSGGEFETTPPPNSNQVKVTKAGSYTVKVTGTNGCFATSAISITEDKATPSTAITADPTSAKLSCNITKVTLSVASGASKYEWSTTGGAFVTPPTSGSYQVEVNKAGSYTVKVTGSNGCVATSSAKSVTGTVTTAPTSGTPTSSTGTTLGCTVQSITLTAHPGGGNGTYTYAWRKGTTGTISGATGSTYNATEAGDYSVRVTSNGCDTWSSKITIGKDERTPDATITPSATEFTCSSASTITLSVPSGASDYAWTTSGGTISSGANTPTATVSKAGTYYVTVKNSLGCEANSSIVITENKTAPTYTGASTMSFCSGATGKTFPAAPTGYSYSWTPSTFSNTTSRAYDVTVTNTATGCTATITGALRVTVNTAPTGVSITGNSPVCAGTTNNTYTAVATGATSYSWSVTGTGWSGSSTANTFTPTVGTANGTIKLIAKNDYGCGNTEATKSVTVNALPATPSSTTAPSPQDFCSSNSHKVSDLTPAPSSTYKWYSASSGGSALSTSTTLTSKNYYVSQTNSNGCESLRRTVKVNVNTTPEAPSATSSQTFCSGAIVADLAATGTSIKWYSSSSSTSQLSTSTVLSNSATYYASQTTNGCESTSRTAVTVTVNALPVAPTATSPQNFCSGATVASLTATGTNIKWYSASSGGTALSTTEALSSTNYYASQTSSSGCESTSRKQVAVQLSTAKPSIATPSTPAAVCTGSSLSLNPPSVTANGTLSGQGWEKETSVGSGSYTTFASPYTVTTADNGKKLRYYATNACGTGYSTAVTITVNTAPTGVSITGNSPVCAGTNNTYTAVATGATSYSWSVTGTGWSGSSTANTFTPTVGTANGTITLIAKNGCGNTEATKSVTVNSAPSQPSSISGNTQVCQGSMQTYSVTNVSGVTYTWTVPSDWTITGQGTSSITATVSSTALTGSRSVSVKANKNNGCGDSPARTKSVTVNAIPAIPSATSPQRFCSGATVANLQASGATGATIKWYSASSGGTALSTTAALSSTNYYASQTSSSGCESTSRKQVVVQLSTAKPTITTPSTPAAVCAGSNLNLSTAPTVTANGTLSGQGWQKETSTAGSYDNFASPYTVTTADNGKKLRYYATNACGTGYSGTVTITVNTAPTGVSITGNSPVCAGSNNTYTVNATGTVTEYAWTISGTSWSSTGSTTSQSLSTKAGTAAGNLQVTVRNGCGFSTVQKDVTVNALPNATISAGVATLTCDKPSTTLSVQSVTGNTYLWKNSGGTTISNISSASISSGGTYYVTVTSSNGCKAESSRTISENKTPPDKPAATTPQSFCSGATVDSLQASGTNIKWYTASSGGAALSTTDALATGTYYASQTSPTNRCESTSRTAVSVTVNSKPSTPTSFTAAPTSAICAGTAGAYDYRVAPVSGATSYVWTLPSAGWFTSGSATVSTTGNSITLTPPAGTSGTYTVSVAAKNACGTSSTLSTSVTVNTAPTNVTISGDSPVCAGSVNGYTADATGTVTGYTWEIVSGTGWSCDDIYHNQSFYIRAGTTAGKLKVTVSNGCGNSTAEKEVAVLPAPNAPNADETQEFCSGATVADLRPTGANIKWYKSTGGALPSTEMLTTTVYYVGQTGANGCESSAQRQVNVTVNPKPTLSVSADYTALSCTTPTVTLTATMSNMKSTDAWTSASSDNGLGSSTHPADKAVATATPPANSYGSKIYSFTGHDYSTGCPSDTKTVSVSVDKVTPRIAFSGTGNPSTVSAGETVTYAVSNDVSGDTKYTWSVPSGWAINSGQYTNQISVTAGSTGGKVIAVASWEDVNNGCTASLERNVTVSGRAATLSDVSAPSPVYGCANSSVTIQASTTTVNNPTFHLYNSSGTKIGSNSTGTFTVTVGSSNVNYFVGISSSEVTESAAGKRPVVTVMPYGTPVPPDEWVGTPTTEVCAGSSYTYTVHNPDNTKNTGFNWTFPSGWSITSGSGTYRVTVRAGSTSGTIKVYGTSCSRTSSSSLDLSVTARAGAPATPSTPTHSTEKICSNGGSPTFNVTAVANATEYVWTLPCGTSKTTTTNSVTTGLSCTVEQSGLATVSVKAKNVCGTSAASPNLTVLVVPKPTTLTISGPATLNNGEEGTYTASYPGSDKVYGVGVLTWRWVLSMLSGASGWSKLSDGASGTIRIKAGTGTAHLTVYCQAASCSGEVSTSKDIEAQCPKPATPGAISGPAAACKGGSAVTYSISPVTGATKYVWTQPNGWSGSSITNSISLTPTSSAISGNITVKVLNSCGESATQTLAVIAGTKPNVTIDPTSASGHYGRNYDFTASGASTYEWSSTPSASITKNGNSASIYVNSVGAYTVKVTGTSNACQSSAEATIKAIGINVTGDGPKCPGEAITLTASLNSSNPIAIANPIFRWYNSDNSLVHTGATYSTTATSDYLYGTVVSYTVSVSGDGLPELPVGYRGPVSFGVLGKPDSPDGITGPSSVTAGQTVRYDVTYNDEDDKVNDNLEWAFPSGWSIKTFYTSVPWYIYLEASSSAQSGKITVVRTNRCGLRSYEKSFSVTVTGGS